MLDGEMLKRGVMVDQANAGTGNSRFEDIGKKVDERVGQVLPRLEEEVKKVITYLNDEVVPQMRQESAQALHAAAEQLRKLAEQLDDRSGVR
jgi:bisphosphoglycerate-dependent phosphoglycerate mutase